MADTQQRTVLVQVPESALQAVLDLVRALNPTGPARGGSTPSQTYADLAARATQGIDCSFELRRRVAMDAARDPLDALQDAELLLGLAQARWREIAAAHGASQG